MGVLRDILRQEDWGVAGDILGTLDSKPDLVIAPDGREPYLYRWHVIPRNKEANVYLHLQVQSDPERPLHDHPWDNQSVILSGGYNELVQSDPPFSPEWIRVARKGMTVARKAEEAHRLILPEGVPYTLTLFTTGPVRRLWGFWIPNHGGKAVWFSHEECLHLEGGKSVFRDPVGARTPDHA